MYSDTTAAKRITTMKKIKAPRFKPEIRKENLLTPATVIPAVNISETASEYILTLAAPGLLRENFDIEIVNDTITMTAKKEMQPQTCVNDRFEYDYTNWTRAFTLPPDADGLLTHAEYHHGELVVHIPRGNKIIDKTNTTIYVY